MSSDGKTSRRYLFLRHVRRFVAPPRERSRNVERVAEALGVDEHVRAARADVGRGRVARAARRAEPRGQLKAQKLVFLLPQFSFLPGMRRARARLVAHAR